MVQSNKLVLILAFTLLLLLVPAFAQDRLTTIVELDQPDDYFVEVARGNVQGQSPLNKFGANPAVGTSLEDVWDYGGLYNYLPIGGHTQVNVTSASNNDVWGGTGAWDVTISGLDENYLEASETVRLNGQTPNSTTTTFIRIFRVNVNNVGSQGYNEDEIFITYGTGFTGGTPSDTSKILAYISPNMGQTLMAQYTVPADKSAVLVKGYATSAGNKNTNIQYFIRVYNQSKRIQFDFDITNQEFIYEFGVPAVVPPRTDMIVEASVDTGTTKVSAGFDLLLIEE